MSLKWIDDEGDMYSALCIPQKDTCALQIQGINVRTDSYIRGLTNWSAKVVSLRDRSFLRKL